MFKKSAKIIIKTHGIFVESRDKISEISSGSIEQSDSDLSILASRLKMVCGDSTIIAKIAMIVMIVSFILATIAIFTPFWQSQTSADGTKVYTGLVVTCNNNIGYCLNLNTILDRYSNQDFYTTMLATLSLSMIGWVFGLAAMIVLIIYACLPNKITGIVAIILCFISGACITAAVIVYGVGLNAYIDSALSWSFGLDAAAGGLAIIAGVIVIINSCLIP